MILEFGNHADSTPRVTTVNVQVEPDADGNVAYTHEVGAMDVASFKDIRLEAMDNDGIYRDVDNHQALLALHGAWTHHGKSTKPAWVNAVDTHGLAPDGVGDDIVSFLSDHYKCDVGRPADMEDRYYTKAGPPGEGDLQLPSITNLLVNDGRDQFANNTGGGLVAGAVGQATASSATSLTTTTTAGSTTAFTGSRVYATTSATNMVFGNIVSCTSGANTVLTVDKWYAIPVTTGATGTTASATGTYVIADGGMVSAWFVGLATGANVPAAADHTLATNGNVEYVTASGGYLRKIAPYAHTFGTTTTTLTPVFTGNGSDSYPDTFTTIGVFTSIVVSFGGAQGPMRFETALNASATVAASGDTVTVTETITGS